MSFLTSISTPIPISISISISSYISLSSFTFPLLHRSHSIAAHSCMDEEPEARPNSAAVLSMLDCLLTLLS